MKKLVLYVLVILTAVGAALLISSCGAKEPTTPTKPTTPATPTTPAQPTTPPATTTPATPATPTATIPKIPHTLEGRTNCLLCHKNGITQAPKFPADHAGRTAETCQACHGTGVAGAPKTPAGHEAAGLIAGNPCLACHQTGVTGAPKFPADHSGRTAETCQACHRTN